MMHRQQATSQTVTAFTQQLEVAGHDFALLQVTVMLIAAMASYGMVCQRPTYPAHNAGLPAVLCVCQSLPGRSIIQRPCSAVRILRAATVKSMSFHGQAVASPGSALLSEGM